MIFLNGAQWLYTQTELYAGAYASQVFPWVVALLLFNICALFATFGGLFERKVIARSHSRLGPMYTGPFGLLQTVADLLKFLRKEIIYPRGSDRFLFVATTFMLTIPSFLAFVVVPIGSFVIIQSDYSLLIALVLLSISPIAILAGSWASNSKYSTLGGLRAAGMTMSYEVLLGIAVASVALTAGSLDIVTIAAYQAEKGMWFAAMQPIAFILFLVGAVASVERNPFDLVEAESELVSGWKTEYGGIYFGLILLAEYIKLLVVALLLASLFLGGWHGALGDIGFMLKAGAFILVMFYIRATAFRMRLDQVLAKVWLRMIPLGLVNFILTIGVMEVVL